MKYMIEAQNISKAFSDQHNNLQVLSNLNISVKSGTIIGILGPSGCGKTTLLNILGAALRADSGQVLIDDIPINDLSDRRLCRIRNKYFGYIMQDFALIDQWTAMDNILIPVRYSPEKQRMADIKLRAHHLAKILDIEDKLNKRVSHLSGGEKQRAAIIRSQILDQPIILADEPTAALDTETTQKVMEFFQYCAKNLGKTIILVTHNPDNVQYCDSTYQLKGGTLQPVFINVQNARI